MTVLSHQTLRDMHPKPILPFYKDKRIENGLSYGLSHAGYDVRIAEDIWLWPFWGRLASTIEHFDIPNDCIAEVWCKSTWRRRFVLVGGTIAEPGWRGFLTLELVRLMPWPILIKAGTPIAQIIFKRLDRPTERPYRGKYQCQQSGPVPARFEK